LPRALVFTPRGPKEWVSTIVPRYQRRLREVNTALVQWKTLRTTNVIERLKRRVSPARQDAGLAAR
jgi:hypothetical protein